MSRAHGCAGAAHMLVLDCVQVDNELPQVHRQLQVL